MEDKINFRAVDQYCKQFTAKVLDGYFYNQDRISGPEILKLSTIHQINLFVIRELFLNWQRESANARSPYFDYSSKEVRDALELYMNALSNNISVFRGDLEPLFVKATRNTLLLVIDPYDFYADLIEGSEKIELLEFRKTLKYLKINRAPLERLVQKIEAKGANSISSNEAFAMLDSILEEVNFTPEDLEGYLTKFASVYPVTLEALYEPKNPSVVREPESVVAKPVENRPKQTINEIPEQPKDKSTVNDKHTTVSKTIADNFKRIDKIKDSLTINQKFMFTKVLFHGDFELFSKAIDDLDRQDNLNGAMRYLESNYDEWDRESEEFHEFMELIEMRFNKTN